MPIHPTKSEEIVYRGIAFRRYPQSNKWADRNYYVPTENYRKQGIGRLHQEIWKDAHGANPEGYHIHHKDENPLNNAIDNLECLSMADHNAYHVSTYTEEEVAKRRELFDRIRPAANSWHKSEDGRAWHKEIAHLHGIKRSTESIFASIAMTNFNQGICDPIMSVFAPINANRLLVANQVSITSYQRVNGAEKSSCIIDTTNGASVSASCSANSQHAHRE